MLVIKLNIFPSRLAALDREAGGLCSTGTAANSLTERAQTRVAVATEWLSRRALTAVEASLEASTEELVV